MKKSNAISNSTLTIAISHDVVTSHKASDQDLSPLMNLGDA
jgi:hypothetical protein